MTCVLDACAMIALPRREPGEAVVWRYLNDAAVDCYAHAANLCEVYYDFYRDAGVTAAEEAVADLKSLRVVERNDFETEFWIEAAKLKAVHRKVSLADCFAITLTKRVDGMLLTSDHHELDSLAKLSVCPITFIR